MTANRATKGEPAAPGKSDPLGASLEYLRLPYIREHYTALAKEAAELGWSHIAYLERLIEGEAHLREDRRIQRRIRLARFPVIKTLDQFNWSWPKKINRLQVQNLFRLAFIEEKANAIFLAGVGLGKSHLSIALGHTACLQDYSVLFTTAIDAINTLAAAHSAGRLKSELSKYLKPRLLILDELGYLPIDKKGADLLFQIISGRYERGSIIITSNRAFKKWPEIFNNDSTLTSALLDRLLHHAETVVMEGSSYRMKDRIES
ncbi:MAG: IS21-like element helper ATPase IstB [Gammaproteobacteria bacterium]